jgi:adenine/guanine phosphoribosyltransferase-like PRPP-binding protein
MKNRIEIAGADHLETLRRCGGYYACPRDANNRRLGPLVGYAGKYDGPLGKMQFVGDVYANFAKAEVYPYVLRFFAQSLFNRVENVVGFANDDVLCGAPIGGYSLADALGSVMDIETIKAEKKVTALATADSREKSELVFARHSVEPGKDYIIVEDVCNNFSTTKELIQLIEKHGGRVVAITCFLNRSPSVDNVFSFLIDGVESGKIPVISIVRKVIAEYRQDDPAVVADIAVGNVAWKPKDEWFRLMKAMEEDHTTPIGLL